MLYTYVEQLALSPSPLSHYYTGILPFWVSLPIFLKNFFLSDSKLLCSEFFKALLFLAGGSITVPLNLVRGCGSCTITYWCGSGAPFQTNKSFFPFGGSQINLFNSLCAPVVPFTQPTYGKLWFLNIVFSAPTAPVVSVNNLWSFSPSLSKSWWYILIITLLSFVAVYLLFFLPEVYPHATFPIEEYLDLFSYYASLVTKGRKAS